ncbi:MaoC family dehydratase [Kribbella speibonae]|uniref:MaoC family dehydratase n=1 Tax=Kribbella speibonae TaxID=1572660 RepID=A0A4R0ITJ3_9ACTN|nr:MaoC family dehydratase [Kribbella speibonae]TCC36437.1 MaoC family dehydratase [Kribbella speibonae]
MTSGDPIARLREAIGIGRGPSPWRTVTQEEINTFADLSGDHYWIHVDPERAKRESPFGTTIAHGNLTLSMIDALVEAIENGEVFDDADVEVGVNMGWNRVRFPSPVPVGSRIRATAELVSVEEKGNGWWELVDRVTVETEGSEKPASVAEKVGRLQLRRQ